MKDSRAAEHGFNPLLIGGVVVVGVVAFIALWALIALGPQLSNGNDGGGHALSKAAPGYAGIVDLLERAGAEVELRRHAKVAREAEFLILAPKHDTKPQEVEDLLRQHHGPALVVLPKWITLRVPGKTRKPGWVSHGVAVAPPATLLPESRFGEIAVAVPSAAARTVTANLVDRSFPVYLPQDAQTVKGEGIETLIAGARGGAVLARAREKDLYILADPDLIDNLAFSSRDRARAAAMLIDAVSEDGNAERIVFDLSLNGFGGGRSLLRFAFVPPFIGITLCLIAAGLLALWQAWARFGPALKPARAIPISKAALIANSADLVRQARRELDGADAYAANQRAAIARRLHAPPGMEAAETDAWIDRRQGGHGDLFSARVRQLSLARNRHEFLDSAQALNDIRKDLLRDG